MRNARVLIFGIPEDCEFQGYADLINHIRDSIQTQLPETGIGVGVFLPWEKTKRDVGLHKIEAVILLDGKFIADEREGLESSVGGWLSIIAQRRCPLVQNVSVKTFRSSGKCLTEEVTYTGYTQ